MKLGLVKGWGSGMAMFLVATVCWGWTPSSPQGGAWGGWSCVASSPSGNWMASASPSGDLAVWYPASGRNHVFFHDSGEAWRAVGVDDDGWTVAAGDRGHLEAISPEGELTVLPGLGVAISALAVVSNGFWVASDDQLLRRENRLGTVTASVVVSELGQVQSLAVSTDGNWLAVGGTSGQLEVRQALDGRLEAHWQVSASALNSVRATSLGWLVAGEDGQVSLWSPQGRLLKKFFLGPGLVTLGVGADGWAAGDREAQVWAGGWISSGLVEAPSLSWVCGAGVVVGLVASPGQWISVTSDAGLRAWRWHSGGLIGEILPSLAPNSP